MPGDRDQDTTHLEIHNTGVVVVLAREQALVKLSWVNIRQRVVLRVPTAVTCVKTAHRSRLVVDDAELLMMREIIHQLSTTVVGVSHAGDVLVQILERVLRKVSEGLHSQEGELTFVCLDERAIDAVTCRCQKS